eukprot:COSAG06_NODE_10912_length_1596_cov_12.704743_1_plen_163_part_00
MIICGSYNKWSNDRYVSSSPNSRSAIALPPSTPAGQKGFFSNSKRQKGRHRALFVPCFCWSRAWLGKCISILHPTSEKCWKRVGKKTFVVVILCVSVPGSQATSSASTPSKRAFALEPNFEPGPPLPNVAGLQSKMELRQHCVTITRALRDSLRDLCTVTCS